MHQDTLAFTQQKIGDPMHPRPPQQEGMCLGGCLRSYLVQPTCDPITQEVFNTK